MRRNTTNRLPFDLVVLRHWREKSRDTNSGQLVTDCISGARVVDMVDESYKNLAAHLPKGNVWLLFPESIDSAGNVVVPTHRGLPDPIPKTIVVVDGTWAEAQRMAKALPGLPRLVPQGGPRASERLLAPPQAGAMATAEAIAALIAEVDPHSAACLDRAYARHVASLKKSNPYKAAIPIVSGIAYYPNPKMVQDVPIEATVRSERIGTKTRELAPGVHVVAQISRTGKEVWITHGEQRLFLYLQDDQGRGSLFYQSFAGTGGKQQGYWFPSGGILANQRGRGVWVIKGNPKTDPGAGREGLLALYEKANAVLPQSDAETDAFVKKATRVDYDDLMYKDEYEIKPTMKILEEGHANALQSKWSSWAYRFWALNALDKTWGKRTFNIKENPLVGFDRVPWKPGNSRRSEATFLSTAYPRLWEEALKNTALRIRVLVARDSSHMGDIGKNLLSIDAAAKRGGEIVILILALSGQSSYALEGMIDETKPMVGDSQRLSRPSPFMLMHNLAESLMSVPEVESMVMRKLGHASVPRSSIDPARVDTWAGRRGALEDSGNALADLFAKYVTAGKVAYKGTSTETSRIKKDLDVMVDYLKRNPGVYEILSGYHELPASDSDLKCLATSARKKRILSNFDIEEACRTNPYKAAIPIVSGIAYAQNAQRNPSQVREFYHATLSGKNNEIVASMIDGIDSSRAQGFGQGAGFYLFAKKYDAVKHAIKLVSGGKEIVKEFPVEGEPIIVVVDATLTPENYDADYEVSARVFRRFLFEHRDWIRDNQTKLGLVFAPAVSGTSTLTGAYSLPDRITLRTGTRWATFAIMAEPSTDDEVTGLGMRLSTLAQRIAAVSPELMRQFEESLLKTLPAVKYVGPKIQPARIEHLDGTVIWRRASKSNPTDLAGRHIPDRYLAGLPPALQKQRVRELTESRDAYKRGDYSELPTDVTARKMGLVKQSNYTTTAKERGVEWRGNAEDMAERVLMVYGGRLSAREVEAFAEALRASFSKGLAAWKSGGHRPGATAQNWAVARVNSLVVGGKTSWTADKKLFEVLPAAVRAKIESMRQKQNPISVEVRLDGGFPAGYGGAAEGKHTRFLQSEAALARIVEQGREVVPRIKFVVDWDKNAAAKRPRIEKGERGVITLIAAAATLQSRADDVEGRLASGRQASRDRKVSLYTAHTILHRLGDRIMPRPEDVMFMSLDSPGFVDRRAALVITARVENAWRLLGEALAVAWNQTGGNDGLSRWLPTVVDTKACREGWVTDGQQAMAELVPYRLLYKKGREQGVKLMSDLPFVPRLEKAFTTYIDACIDQFTGQEVLI